MIAERRRETCDSCITGVSSREIDMKIVVTLHVTADKMSGQVADDLGISEITCNHCNPSGDVPGGSLGNPEAQPRSRHHSE